MAKWLNGLACCWKLLAWGLCSSEGASLTRLGGGGRHWWASASWNITRVRADCERRVEGRALRWQAGLSHLQKVQSGAWRKEKDERKQLWNRPGQSKEWEKMGTVTQGGAEPAGQVWRGWEEEPPGLQVFSHLWKRPEGKAGVHLSGSGGDKGVMGGGQKRAGQGFQEREASIVNTFQRRSS